jgi:hypothetical protein
MKRSAPAFLFLVALMAACGDGGSDAQHGSPDGGDDAGHSNRDASVDDAGIEDAGASVHGLDGWVPNGTCRLDGEPGDGVFPLTLTDTGCFVDVPGRVPAPGLIPFEINSPLWSDGAAKRRFLVLPGEETIGFTEHGAWQMPVGTILIKEFLLELVVGDPKSIRPMETRFLVHRGADVWEGFSFQWNDAATEAMLLPDRSTTVDYAVEDGGVVVTHTHSFPSRGECVRCHNAAAGRVLGLQTGQLNRLHDYGSVVDNQLAALDAIGRFGDPLPDPPDDLFVLPEPTDDALPIESRVRSYYHANCSHCHRPDGERPNQDFRYETALAGSGLCDLLTPGDSAASRLYQRDTSRPGMPPLASLIPDPWVVDNVASWIDGMATCP